MFSYLKNIKVRVKITACPWYGGTLYGVTTIPYRFLGAFGGTKMMCSRYHHTIWWYGTIVVFTGQPILGSVGHIWWVASLPRVPSFLFLVWSTLVASPTNQPTLLKKSTVGHCWLLPLLIRHGGYGIFLFTPLFSSTAPYSQ